MGCAASAAHQQAQNQSPQAITVRTQHYQQQQFNSAPLLHPRHAQQRQTQPQQPQANADHLKSAPLVRSLVSLQRDSCQVESSASGSYLSLSCQASVPGHAIAYLRAVPPRLAEGEATPQSLEPLEARQIARAPITATSPQVLRFQLCSGELGPALEGSQGEDEGHQLVVDLVATVSDPYAITVQRSFLKFTWDGNSASAACSVAKQMVQCGSAVRTLEALYGTIPNPRQAKAGNTAETSECVVCMTEAIDTVILHCRHVCLCSNCAKTANATWSFQCPVCRGRVAAMVALKDAAGT